MSSATRISLLYVLFYSTNAQTERILKRTLQKYYSILASRYKVQTHDLQYNKYKKRYYVSKSMSGISTIATQQTRIYLLPTPQTLGIHEN